jgi:hypothetical protein
VADDVARSVEEKLSRFALVKMALLGLSQMTGASLDEIAGIARMVADVAKETNGENLRARPPRNPPR